MPIEGGSAGSRGEDSLRRGEDPGVREVSRDVEDLNQQFGGDCWFSAERHGKDPSLIC